MATELTAIPTDTPARARRSQTLHPAADSVTAQLRDELERAAADLADVDPARVLRLALRGLPPGADAAAAGERLIAVAAELIVEDPAYSRFAARLLANRLQQQTQAAGIDTFGEAIRIATEAGLVEPTAADFVAAHAARLEAALDHAADERFEYFGLRVLADRYLLRHPETRAPLERPQHFWLRVAVGLADTLDEVVALYRLFSRLEYVPSTPTLFNAATRHPQLSSCFLVDSPADDLRAIYEAYTEVAMLSKFAGGIGLAFSRVRARGSLIRGTNGHSNGIVPFLKTLDASVAAVNQGGKRKGAACVYLEPWHADIEEFLELRDNTGDEARRTHNLNLAVWVPDLFMERVRDDANWSLFDPADVPALPDRWGDAFDAAYEAAERAGLATRTLPARQLYRRMVRTLAETGNGWMTFKDAANAKSNQTARPEHVIHHANLCTEIVEVSSADETAVCNLGSINLVAHLLSPGTDGAQDPAARVDWAKLAATVRTAIRALDRSIDRTWYPTPRAAASNRRWRPVGLGVMGLHDLFFALGLAFDDPAARRLSRRLAEEIYYHAVAASAELAAERGPHPAFAETRAADGVLQFDLWGVAPADLERWAALRARIRAVGLRNSLLVAIAPTATIASIAGVSECIEPLVSNLFKRETLSGDFVQLNRHLVRELKALGRWDPATRARIVAAGGSVQGLDELPADLRHRFRTAWELPQRALIDLAAERGPFVDQSQSLNLFVARPSIERLSAMYFHAWQCGLKTTYYLRSRPATEIAKVTVALAPTSATACALDNPDACEACQ